jgi:hypothetical protein
MRRACLNLQACCIVTLQSEIAIPAAVTDCHRTRTRAWLTTMFSKEQPSGKDVSTVPHFPTPFAVAAAQCEYLFMDCAEEEGFAETILLPPARTRAERRLDMFTHAVRTKWAWWDKLRDESTISKWRSEAAAQHLDANAFGFAIKVPLLCRGL